MLYDVVYVRIRHTTFPEDAIEEVIKKVNKICQEGHRGRKGWQPQGGLTMTINDCYTHVTQAVVCCEGNENNKEGHVNVRMV